MGQVGFIVMRVGIPSKGFKTGQKITFYVYDFDGNQVDNADGTEVGSLGFYYADFKLSPFKNYLVIVYENGEKIACRPIYRSLKWGLRDGDDVKAPDNEYRRFLRGDYNLDGWNG